MRDQRFKARSYAVLPARATYDRRLQATGKGCARGLIERGIVRVYHHQNIVDAGMRCEGADRARQHGLAANGAILLWLARVRRRPCTAASRHDKGRDSHARPSHGPQKP